MKADSMVGIKAAETLLDVGVSLPFFKIPFIRKTIRLTMRRPCLGNLIQMTRLYLQTGVIYEQMVGFSKDEELAYMAIHGKTVSKMVALSICRGAISGRFAGIMAWLIRWFVPHEYLQGANMEFLSMLGTKPFMPIIRSISMSNPMRPRLSQDEKKGS